MLLVNNIYRFEYKSTRRFGDISNWIVAGLDLSPFWRVAVLGTTKTATYQNGGYPRCFGCRRFGCIAVLVVAVLDVSPFWMCRRFGCVAFLIVAVLDLSPF